MSILKPLLIENAAYDKGILKIVMPKAKVKSTKQVKIKVKKRKMISHRIPRFRRTFNGHSLTGDFYFQIPIVPPPFARRTIEAASKIKSNSQPVLSIAANGMRHFTVLKYIAPTITIAKSNAEKRV